MVAGVRRPVSNELLKRNTVLENLVLGKKTSTEVCFIINLNRCYVQMWLGRAADRPASDVREKDREIWGVGEVGIHIHLAGRRGILIALMMFILSANQTGCSLG